MHRKQIGYRSSTQAHTHTGIFSRQSTRETKILTSHTLLILYSLTVAAGKEREKKKRENGCGWGQNFFNGHDGLIQLYSYSFFDISVVVVSHTVIALKVYSIN